MTSRAAETQKLIADIDHLLINKRLSRFLSSQASEPRQVLERIRDFLATLSESDAQTQPQQSPLLAKFIEQGHHQSLAQQNELQQDEETHVVTRQQSNPLATVLAPLQEEIKALLQERANLVEEIRQLEQKRLHNYSLAQQLANQEQVISEFLQVLSSRIVPNSTPQPAETAASSQMQQFFKIDTATSLFRNNSGSTEPATSSTPPVLDSPDQVEHLSRLARELDQKLLALDGTVNVVFEALQRNIHTYDESLSQALARMHSKGVQGEQLLASLISNLTSQLQQQTPTDEPSRQDVNDETIHSTESQQLASEVPDFKQVEASSSVIENNQPVGLEAQEETASTPYLYLDADLFEIRQDEQNSIETSDITGIPQHSSPLMGDEVDQLYASLFGVEVTDVTVNSSALASGEVTNITNELVVKSTTTPPALATDTVTDKLPAPTSTETIDELFVEPTANASAVTTDAVADITVVETDEDTDVTDKLSTTSTEFTVTGEVSADTPPVTVTDQLQSESFLYEVVFEAPEVATDEVADVTGVTDDLSVEVSTPPSELTLSETVPDAATHQEQQGDSTADFPDPWLEEPTAGRLELSSNDVKQTQDVPLEPKEQSSIPQENTFPELPPAEGRSQVVSLESTSQLSPANEDTITTLTDLLTDLSHWAQPSAVSPAERLVQHGSLFEGEGNRDSLVEVPSSDRAASTAPVTSEAVETPRQTPVAETSEVEIQNPDVEWSSDNYIPASPQEDLLSPQENQHPEMIDISLEEAQLQQLEQDLASFDGEINALLQPLTQSENQQAQSRRSPLPEQAETQTDSSATGAQVAEIEKTNIATEETLEGSSVSIPNLTNNTDISPDARQSVWYLGIDLGTTGISAALLNRSTTEVYPLYWSAQTQPEATSIKRSFRLPAEVYLPTASVTETQSKESQEQTAPAAVAEEKVPEEIATGSTLPHSAAAPTHNLFSAQLKPYLHIALPYKSERQKWEPVLQLNEFSTVPLVWVVRSLSKLLLTLMSDPSSTTLGLTAAAVGLDQESFSHIISKITGVICTCPSHWSEQYRFNIREAILISKLVQHPQQVFFVEEAIACLLSELDGAEGEIVKIRGRQGSRPARASDRPLVGNTLVINIGAGATEMALVDLPENLQDLTYNDFMLHGFAYAGKGLEQDIICQLLFPQKWRQSRMTPQEDNKTITSKPWHWQPTIPGLDQMRFSSLGLEELSLPQPGEPEIVDRIRIQQRLESSVLGKAVIDAAVALKLILQHQESFTLELADQRWVLQRRDLESQVFVPFVRRLNRELNRLLVAKGIPTEAINQTILTGGVASLGAVSRWLRQKLPNAKIIQDFYLGENGSPTCSRVAYGLAVLPLHPQVLEVPRQQYTDYFLFTELLRILPSKALSFGEVIQLFENRGINTRSCQQRLLAFLEGELPPGLIPTSLDAIWLTQGSCENSDYKTMTAASLFEKQGSLTYRPNVEQLRTVARYLDAIKASTQQSLEEPYTVNFALGVVD
ncbi:hypothetical protein [Mastigocladopsis repens]|uniref:hypothetical protein n=1 Tax=Mastigocladopsis repens TaxID=221287 RepID=UPI0002F351EB|nr:hypothetical protein [Mastigocladopsis repens]